jgi:hypothetical protein
MQVTASNILTHESLCAARADLRRWSIVVKMRFCRGRHNYVFREN